MRAQRVGHHWVTFTFIWEKLTKNLKITNYWRNTPCSWVQKLNIVKMSVPPNFMYRFIAMSVKIPADFVKIGKMILFYFWQSDFKVVEAKYSEEWT